MRTKTAFVSSISPEFALLGFLAKQPAHGYELHQRLVIELGQVWRISLSQTYNILNRLETQGLVAGSLEGQHKLPARRTFHLTPSGKQRFENWLQKPSGSSARAIRVEFTTRLYFAHQASPAFVEKLISAQIAETRVGVARLKSTLEGIPQDQIFNRLGLELRIRQLASVIDWLQDCSLELVQPK